MGELAVFRELLRAHRRGAGRSQGQLATAIGLHPNVLSHKLNAHGRSVLTTPEVVGIVTTLAGWGALGSRADAEALLAAGGVPPHAVPPTAWASAPLSALPSATSAPPGSATPPDPGDEHRAGENGPAAGPPDRPIPPPAPLTRLVGRREARQDVATALATSRLVTLTGVGGTGKTRLAVQVAADVEDQFPDGVGFVDLASVRSPAMLPVAVAKACGIATGTADPTAAMAHALAGKDLLLVVDNVEHLVEGASSLGRLLEALPGLHVLATSRVALRLYGEHVVRVPPLAVPDPASDDRDIGDAVRLFVERARAAGHPVGETADELGAVRDICAWVDGLPLAIELAAAKTRTYPPAELLRRLQDRSSVLDDGPRDAPVRHRTLRDTLDWSFALLPAPTQRLLACLGVLAGPFDLAAAVAVAGEPRDEVEGSLAELVDHHLVERRPGSGHPFALLQTIREYALARLAETGLEDEAERRNLVHQLAHVRGFHRPPGDFPADALAVLDVGYPNIRVALDHAIREGESDPSSSAAGLRLATATIPFWLSRGPISEGMLYLQELLGVDRGRADAGVRAEALLELCALACFAGDYSLGPEVGRECLDLFEELGDERGLARAYRYAGEVPYAVGDLDTAEPMFREGLRIARENGDAFGQGLAANMLGQLLNHRGARVEARRHLCDAVGLFTSVGGLHYVSATLHSLSEVARDDGDLDGAAQLLHVALRSSVAGGSSRVIAACFEGLASISSLRGDHALALDHLGTARALRDRVGARLAPVEDASLTLALAGTLEAVTATEQRAAMVRARTASLDDACREVLRDSHPVVASGTDDELAARAVELVAAQCASDD